jgi:hypothetical protein
MLVFAPTMFLQPRRLEFRLETDECLLSISELLFFLPSFFFSVMRPSVSWEVQRSVSVFILFHMRQGPFAAKIIGPEWKTLLTLTVGKAII